MHVRAILFAAAEVRLPVLGDLHPHLPHHVRGTLRRAASLRRGGRSPSARGRGGAAAIARKGSALIANLLLKTKTALLNPPRCPILRILQLNSDKSLT